MTKYLMILAALFALVACGGDESNDPVDDNALPDADALSESEIQALYQKSDGAAQRLSPALTAANTDFAFRLFRSIDAQEPGKNLFIAPFSISVALAMTYNAARNDTQDQMSHTLGYDPFSVSEVNDHFRALLDSISFVDVAAVLKTANSFWLSSGWSPRISADFIQLLKDDYDSAVGFYDDINEGCSLVNDWIAEQTEDKITDMLDPAGLDPTIVFFLVNALYFKSSWTTPFEEHDTVTDTFTRRDGTTVEVPFMRMENQFSVCGNEGYSLLRLPYGREKIALYIVKPSSSLSIDEQLSGLTSAIVDQCIADPLDSGLVLELPRFKLDYFVELGPLLVDMGMPLLFSKSADLSGMQNGGNDLYIDFVKHRAFITVDEKGSEAGGATVVAGLPKSSPLWRMSVPFLFFIRDDRSGTILFLGKVENPIE
ncbi:MAG TPA: serpin family protein [bacterium]|nr:serpin family protein [bacterium]